MMLFAVASLSFDTSTLLAAALLDCLLVPIFLVPRIPTGYCYLECKHGLGELFPIATVDRTLPGGAIGDVHFIAQNMAIPHEHGARVEKAPVSRR